MKTFLSKFAARAAALALAVLPVAAFASPTNIAQLPLLNINGTGSVKPNLMLLFDNSGSMDQAYTPDYIVDNICRSGATLAQGVTSCTVGMPPYMSPDFNRQYYNPAIRYQPPVTFDGTPYAERNRTNTGTWASVLTDGFGKSNKKLDGSTGSSTNLLTEIPDIKWCNSDSSDCRTNTSYAYPDSTYFKATSIKVAPYYYVVNVSEYCTDDTLSKCVSTTIGGPAPTGYPVPSKLRWCDSTALTDCQAKHVGNFIYPKHSTPSGTLVSYGTLTIGASITSAPMSVASVSITNPDSGGPVAITSAAVSTPNGTNTPLARQILATALASNIASNNSIDANGYAYWACVKTPNPANANLACSKFGLALTSDDIVAVVPLNCSGSAKNLTACQAVNDSSNNPRAGWLLSASTPLATAPAGSTNRPTAIIQISAKASKSGTIKDVKLGGTTISGTINFAKNDTSATLQGKIITFINNNAPSNIRAYAAGDNSSNTSIRCAQETGTGVCIVDTNATATGAVPAFTSITSSNGYTINFVNASLGQESVTITTVPLSSGASAPSAFTRVNIVSGQTYPKTVERVDCVAQSGVCTYDEEMTNFANWYSYYRTRMQMMKTSVGLAFTSVTDRYRVGLALLSDAAASTPKMSILPTDFVGTARDNWYKALYATTSSGSTPMRAAMHNVGKMFAAQNGVIQFECQQNFMIVTTDGYWNGGGPTSPTIASNDNKEDPDRFCLASKGCVDKRVQSGPSLADVALYWYNGGSDTDTVSLRPDLGDDMTKLGTVPAAAGENTHLHVNTFTLGLGMDGVMTYDPKYDTSPKAGGDFYNLITGVSTGCPWNGGGAYVWPDPDVTNSGNTVQERVDDLWHAAVNGRGRYFSANKPKEVENGLRAALEKMQVTPGAASAAATSTPNVTQSDKNIFSATFTTVKWYGEVTARDLDPTDGTVEDTVNWSSSSTVGSKVTANSDTRNIWTINDQGSVIPFKYSSMSALMKGWFDNKCSSLPQCTLLSTADRNIVNGGANVVDWLRGQQQYADDARFRAYTLTDKSVPGFTVPVPIVLGDVASSKPAYVRDPRKNYPDGSYQAFKAERSTRDPVVYVGANDGMLHGFDATTGEELMAYVPRITMKKLWQLSSTNYGTNHFYSVDGSPEVADVQIGGQWRTVLVAGLNGGGRGFYALDVTDKPAPNTAPKVLWELCADATICTNNDPDIGLTFSNPQMGMWQNKWVVLLTSGYNNIPNVEGVNSGNGQGWLYIVDVSNGKILKKISTGSGDTTTPSGLAKLTAITDDPNTDPNLTYVYGGDNLGQMWRFDLTDKTSTNVGLLKMGDAGPSQPITTRPDVTLCAVQQPSGSQTAQRVVLFGTGRLLDVPDVTNTDMQSLYLIKDSGANINVRGSGMVEQVLSSSINAAGETFKSTNKPVDLRTQNGWFFDWKLTLGERMNLDPQIVGGAAGVVTNIPSSTNACSVGGRSNMYVLDVCNGNGVNSDIVGATSDAGHGDVGFIIISLPSGEKKAIVTTAQGKTNTANFTDKSSAAAHPVGWRRVKGE